MGTRGRLPQGMCPRLREKQEVIFHDEKGWQIHGLKKNSRCIGACYSRNRQLSSNLPSCFSLSSRMAFNFCKSLRAVLSLTLR